MKTNIEIAAAAIGGLLLGAGLSGAIGIAPGVLHAHRIGPYYEAAKINIKTKLVTKRVGYDKVRDGMTNALYAHQLRAGFG